MLLFCNSILSSMLFFSLLTCFSPIAFLYITNHCSSSTPHHQTHTLSALAQIPRLNLSFFLYLSSSFPALIARCEAHHYCFSATVGHCLHQRKSCWEVEPTNTVMNNQPDFTPEVLTIFSKAKQRSILQITMLKCLNFTGIPCCVF